MGKTFHIVKRDGTLVPFDEQKIINAIEKANVTMEHEREKISPAEVQNILSLIQYRLETDEKNGKNLTVEEIQDIIVHSLLKMGHEKLGLSYECYRVTKSALRDMQTSTSFEQTYESIMKLVNGSNKDVQEENSNKDASINSTQRDLIAGEVSKYFTDKYLLPRKIVKAHEDGVLHFHDKDYFIQPMTNCFDKSERFITADGTKSFADFKDGDKVLVPTHKGNLKEATVKNFGIQKLQAVTFSKHRLSQKVVHCTANHRWILADGTETTDLKVGDKIFAAPDMQDEHYVVVNIQPAHTADVWCLEVEDDHSFILEGGLVTGNCCLINISDMLDNGTVMNGLEIHSPHTFKTAATVMTQVVASVASNQYGFEK